MDVGLHCIAVDRIWIGVGDGDRERRVGGSFMIARGERDVRRFV